MTRRPGCCGCASALDAMLLSLGANAQHGKRREPGDYRRAYQIAVKYELAGAGDTEAVRLLLRCSERWARELTAEIRQIEQAARDAAIQRGRDEGKGNRQIAREVSVDERTVRRAAADRHSAVAPQSDPVRAPSRADAVRAGLAEMESPRVKQWHRALQALREINAQDPVEALMAEPHRRIAHVFGPELRQDQPDAAAPRHVAAGDDRGQVCNNARASAGE